jgi:hypothetical protein
MPSLTDFDLASMQNAASAVINASPEQLSALATTFRSVCSPDAVYSVTTELIAFRATAMEKQAKPKDDA